MEQLVLSQALKFRILRHLLLVMTMVLLFTAVACPPETDVRTFFSVLQDVAVNALFFFAYAYTTVYLLIPRLLLKRKMLWFGLSFVAAGLLLSVAKFLFSDLVFHEALAPEDVGVWYVLDFAVSS
ncbi:MAG: hypothetical protein R2751_02560 [Bacteroidales bacterium]